MDDPVITAASAADLAGITYRQLDHWARKGWVVPTVDAGSGRSGRRLYAPTDVVRLAALRHFAQSRRNLSVIGPDIATVDIAGAAFLVLDQDDQLTSSTPDSLIAAIVTPGSYTVFDVRPVARSAGVRIEEAKAPKKRRSA